MSTPYMSPHQARRSTRTTIGTLCRALAIGWCLTSPLTAADIFREAEDASNSNMTTNGAYRPQTPEEAAKLSGQKWFNGKITDETPLYAEYEITAPEAGTYHLFIRKYWQHGAFRWRVDDGEWQEIPKGGLLDSVIMREYVPLNWVSAGDIPLNKGTARLRIEVTHSDSNTTSDAYGFDCLLLSTGDLSDYLQSHPDITGDPK